jgi:hypothetical protein
MHLDEVFLQLELRIASDFIDMYEAEITKAVRTGRAIGHRWSRDARQTLRYAMFLRFYAVFENHLKRICARFTTSRSLKLSVSDINGKGFLNQVNRFLKLVVSVKPLEQHPLWQEMLAYLWVRNAIAHRNGELAQDEAIPQHVNRLLKSKSGIEMGKNRTIVMGRHFCKRAMKQMAIFLVDVGNQ